MQLPKLKPDAPEFVPRSLRNTENSDSSDQVETKDDQQMSPEVLEHNHNEHTNLTRTDGKTGGRSDKFKGISFHQL